MGNEDRGTIKEGGMHPMTHGALRYISTHTTPVIVEAMASTALSGNETAEICLSTYNRLASGEPVSDRYVLGLAWFLKEALEGSKKTFKPAEK